jgi:hypothetical protein
MLPFVFWNGIYCKRINEDQPGPIWHLETLSGSRYWVHYFQIELASFLKPISKGKP